MSNQEVIETKEKIDKKDKRYVFVALNKKLFEIVEKKVNGKQLFFGSKATLIQFIMNMYLDPDNKLGIKTDSILKELEEIVTLLHTGELENKRWIKQDIRSCKFSIPEK